MSKLQRQFVKKSRSFYRNSLRRSLTMLIVSLALNVFFSIWLYRCVAAVGEPTYYATSGIKPPIRLDGLAEPNFTNTPLLPDDPSADDEGFVTGNIPI